MRIFNPLINRHSMEQQKKTDMENPRVQAVMNCLLNARGLTLDGEGSAVRQQVAYYQSMKILHALDSADSLERILSIKTDEIQLKIQSGMYA